VVGGTCDSLKNAEGRGIATTRIDDRSTGATDVTRIIVGLAPRDAKAVKVITRGNVLRTPVVDGVFIMRDAEPFPPDRFALVTRN